MPLHVGRPHVYSEGHYRRVHQGGRLQALPRLVTWLVGVLLVAGGDLGCSDLSRLAGSQALPAGVQSPSELNNPAGALALYNEALASFEASVNASGNFGGFNEYIIASGVLSDELQPGTLGGTLLIYQVGGTNTSNFAIDALQMPEVGEGVLEGDPYVLASTVYETLQAVRNQATQAIGALTAYDTNADPALRGQMYALKGYSEILLADLFCSGIPLSTIVFQGDYLYRPGSTTSQVYQDAVAQLDSAIAVSADSVRILNLARVGVGRALLALGQYAQAASTVASVPDTFAFQFLINWETDQGTEFTGQNVTESDQEGGDGLPYISSGDPRTAAALNPDYGDAGNLFGVLQYVPTKYGTGNGISAITVASGVEARLIQAEAALQAGDLSDWLTQLNRARTLSAPSLPVASDPGTDSARVSLLFQERAYDLFLTGHRQGDMRRLIRQYGRDPNTVYPTGPYPGPISSLSPNYGSDVTAPIPNTEYKNPLFTGCLDRGA